MPRTTPVRSSALPRTLAMIAGACLTCGLASAQSSSAPAKTPAKATTPKTAAADNRIGTAAQPGKSSPSNEKDSMAEVANESTAGDTEAVKNAKGSSNNDKLVSEKDGKEKLGGKKEERELSPEEQKALLLEQMLREQKDEAEEKIEDDGLQYIANDVSYQKQADLEKQRSGMVVVTEEDLNRAKNQLMDLIGDDTIVTDGDSDSDTIINDCGMSPELAALVMPATLNLTGTVRDFVGRQDDQVIPGQVAHPDFEVFYTSDSWNQPQYWTAAGAIINVAGDDLDADEKPAFRSLGQMIGSRDWVSNDPGKPVTAIMGPRDYIQWKPTDTIAEMSYPSCDYAGVPTTLVSPPPPNRQALEASMGAWDVRAIVGPDTFAQWYRDVPGVNLSQSLTITLVRTLDTTTNSVKYVFDDRQDPEFINRHGFYPINGALFGNGTGFNCWGQSVNSHFTFELDTTFIYKRGCGQIFTFNGDDDVWVFIDNKLVIDLSGTHCVRGQTIDLDRLTWLQDRQPYKLKFFSAERQRCGSNIRIETNLELRTVGDVQSTGLFD